LQTGDLELPTGFKKIRELRSGVELFFPFSPLQLLIRFRNLIHSSFFFDLTQDESNGPYGNTNNRLSATV